MNKFLVFLKSLFAYFAAAKNVPVNPVAAVQPPPVEAPVPEVKTLPQKDPTAPFIDPKFINAIIEVESSGNDHAIGDGGHAFGCMQIWQGDTDIANKYLGTHYKASDCLGNRPLSILLFIAYFKVFTSIATDEDRAKAWNGGAGWKKFYGKPGHEQYSKNLDLYWEKVQKYL